MADQAFSLLLNLPPEIQSAVFAHVITFPRRLVQRVHQRAVEDQSSEDEDNVAVESKRFVPSYPLSLLITSKRIEREAAPLFYELNTFHFPLPNLDAPALSFASDSSDDDDAVVPARDISTTPNLDKEADTVTSSAIISVPTRHLSSLRSLSLLQPLNGHWPDGPKVLDHSLGPHGLGVSELEDTILWLAERNLILNVLSVTLQRSTPVGLIQWDDNPSTLLAEFNRGARISTALERFSNLKRLRVWKSRRYAFREGEEKRLKLGSKDEWRDLGKETLESVRREHFSGAQAVRYARWRGENGADWKKFIGEGFEIEFGSGKWPVGLSVK